MARKTSKIETVLTETTNTAEETTVETAAEKKATGRKAAQKAQPEKELDWRALGLVKEHQSARARAIRKIDRVRLAWLYYVATAFLAGLALGVLLSAWLH